jgi:CelD/BcsL family acetyltransferase involved in cellulose biosynthesis
MAAMMAATPGGTFADTNQTKGNALNAPQPDRMKPCLEVAVIRDPQAFAALEEEWDDLYHNCPRATPYQYWAWLYSWWEAYGEGYELRLITVRSGEGLLVGLIPLMLERRWGFGKLLFIGTGLASDYLDVLVRRDWEAEVCEAGVQALEHMDGWHIAELRNIGPTATIWDFLKGWNGPRIDLQQGPLWVIEVKPWDELVKSLPKSQRTPARRTLRRAEEDGVHSVLSGPEEAEQAARRLLALHREQRLGRNILPERLTAWFESYTLAAARRMTECGLGGISEFWRDVEVIVSSFLIFDNDLTVPYMVGANQEAMRRYQWSTLFIWDALNIARSRNCSYVSLLTGPEEYKQRWSKEVPYYRIVLGRSPILWRFYLSIWRCYRAYRSLRLRVRGYLRSDTTPKWVKDTAKLMRRRDA